MHLFETKEGDKWVCITCRAEQSETIENNQWEWIFEREDPILRCSICGHPDYEIED
jgi:rubrerythrin